MKGRDGARTVGPLPPDYANPGTKPPAGVDFGGYFASINRNKRSVVLDLKQEDDRETLLLLCEQADAIVENMRVGVMDRLGVGYEVIRKRNPRIVYGALRGFGDPRTGESPYADWPAYDIVAIAAPGPAHWRILCEAMSREDLIDDPRTGNPFVRSDNVELVEKAISEWTSVRTKQDIMGELGGRVPCGPVNTAADIFADPHVVAREMISRFKLPGDNPEVAIAGSPLKFQESPTAFYRRAPRLGEHNEEVLREFGLSDRRKSES